MACPTQRSALTAATVLALVLATARGFVLGTARCHHHCNAHPLHPVTTATAATHRPSSRATRRTASRPPSFSLVPLSPSSMCFAGSPAAVTHQASSPFSSAVNREIAGGNDALRPSCRPEVIAGSRTTATMGLGLASCLMPGTGRKVAMVGLVNAAAFATVGGGVLAGGLHAVSGPDHLAALLPRIMGQKWHKSMRIGATWGLGHGFSATVIGLAAFFFKDRMGLGNNSRLVAAMSTWTEGLVGLSLIAIGLLGLKESVLDYDGVLDPVEGGGAGGSAPQSVGAAGVPARGAKRAIFFNGVLHGFSWDGAPSLAPALALSSWSSVLWFLLAYCSGTMVAMSATTTIIGEGSVRVGKALDMPDIPRKLSVASSFVAITIGAVWLAKAVLL